MKFNVQTFLKTLENDERTFEESVIELNATEQEMEKIRIPFKEKLADGYDHDTTLKAKKASEPIQHKILESLVQIWELFTKYHYPLVYHEQHQRQDEHKRDGNNVDLNAGYYEYLTDPSLDIKDFLPALERMRSSVIIQKFEPFRSYPLIDTFFSYDDDGHLLETYSQQFYLSQLYDKKQEQLSTLKAKSPLSELKNVFPSVMQDCVTRPILTGRLDIGYELAISVLAGNLLSFKSLVNEYQQKNPDSTLADIVRKYSLFALAAGNSRTSLVNYFIEQNIPLEQTAVFTLFDKAFEMTPLACVVYAHSMRVMSENIATPLINALLKAGADYNFIVTKKWDEDRGMDIVECSEKVKLFDFDSSGLLSRLVNAFREEQNQGAVQGLQGRIGGWLGLWRQPPSQLRNLERTEEEQPEARIQALERQVAELTALVQTLQTRFDAYETQPQEPHQQGRSLG